MSYKELLRFYKEHYSLGYLNTVSDDKFTSFEKRIILISLICYVVEKNKSKNPDFTHYSFLYKLNTKLNLPEEFIKGLAIVCEDFSYQEHNFPTFGLEGKKILEEIISILKTYVPF